MAAIDRPDYLSVFWIFVRNNLVRAMSFRANFIIECISSVSWTLMNLGFYLLVFRQVPELIKGTGWGQYEFFVFLSTTMLVNSLVQAFFMPNAQEFSELIRTGGLDFALLKPIDTQFLVSLQRIEWSSFSNFFVGLGLLAFSLWKLTTDPDDPLTLSPFAFVLYPFYVLCGIGILYSLMISLAATSIWLGRNQTLYNFWFYITNFSRYPMEIYRSYPPLQFVFTFVIPILIVVNVPAKMMAMPIQPEENWGRDVLLPVFAVIATLGSLLASRFVFQSALKSYRSASS